MAQRPYPITERQMQAIRYGDDTEPGVVREALEYHEPLAQPSYMRREKATYQERFLFCKVDGDLLKGEKPPAHIQAMFEEIVGKSRIWRNGKEWMCVRFHPVLRRWCTYERRLDPERGENIWQVIMVHMEAVPHAKYLPPDILALPASDRQFVEHLVGWLGDYTLPDREDWEQMMLTCRGIFTPDEVEANLAAIELKKQRAHRSDQEAFDHDTVSYLGNAYIDAMNQEAGSGQRMRSVATIDVKSNPTVYRIERRKGFTVRTKLTAEDARREREAYDYVMGNKDVPEVEYVTVHEEKEAG